MRWLRDELPELVAAGAITAENSRAIEEYYASRKSAAPHFGVVLLSMLGSALVAAGIVLLVAHNWDEFSRPVRSVFAFVPLLAAQALTVFVLLRRDESKPWRESAAIFNVAAVGTAISLVSQTYQITGSLADFVLVWMLLGIPLVYLLRTTLGAIAYLIGALVWLLVREKLRGFDPLYFWALLLLIVPYFAILYWRARESRETAAFAILLAATAAVGLVFTADFSKTGCGVLAFAGLFTLVYLCGIEFFLPAKTDRLHPLASLGGIALGAMAIILTFQDFWKDSKPPVWPAEFSRALSLGIEAVFPLAALALAGWLLSQRRVRFSFLAMGFPVVVILGWFIATRCAGAGVTSSTACAKMAALLFDLYALALGVELIARGLRADSLARANFGLLMIAALGVARFFDSDLTFVVRAIGFIVIGLGFLGTNFLLFRRRQAT